MGKKKIIPLTTKEGHNYLIQFEFIGKEHIPQSVKADVVDVLISVENNVGINNGSTLSQFASILKEFLVENNVVLYCYCDHAEIIRARKQSMSPQEYRSKLFSAMFDKQNNSDYINQLIIINDEVDHYIHLISLKENEEDVVLLRNEVLNLK
ncbi:hypothetical protein [Pedobacter endophyticus]|uniref:Uncharacterized protein n=1 Tax=Pedobacter endophyticus TaxID=2789740 RepID=A0A7S9L198_9SPHI|nr:hypothetical protein [Pedobacter endophyticus]QPH40645.1 hypothetical protein IZT61_05055 [Pedobacter endophyticus]